MPVHNGPRYRAWAHTEELDAWATNYVPGKTPHVVPQVARRRLAKAKAG
ncbi:MAG TPA: hypothetical protein VLT62_30975 [Candidatus Methylomirabilis sp.]|nr:hypothetical protein [Candidatus Methylomirabilis sp.]